MNGELAANRARDWQQYPTGGINDYSGEAVADELPPRSTAESPAQVRHDF
ncbi:hypothetical protein [Polluticaenibacter yanchengensis]|uniref:Uncharacterized protein n=1 Tax=Polluticaenibacter yanchengensis TaxID=3014562 RepID=A0ABT4UGL3_9BACT|nr:hypothetical protein [Chitinophagaceae bacterium LY-5]